MCRVPLPSTTPKKHPHKAQDEAMLAVLRELGIDLIPIELPSYEYEHVYITVVAEGAAAFNEITYDDLDDMMRRQDDEAWANTFRAARFFPATEYVQSNRLRSQMMRDMAQIMADIDVFVVPSFGGEVLRLTNYTGHPCVVLPNGLNEHGTPANVSISFIGGLDMEAETLAVAKAYQDATDWHLRHPTI